MFCLISDNSIVLGPAPWNLSAILEPLIIAGFDLREGVLFQREVTEGDTVFHPICPFPDSEPLGPLMLPGFTLLPAAELDEPAPGGKSLAGHEPVILEDRVELRPIWVDLPPPPSLEEVKVARRIEVDALRDSRLRLGFAFERDGLHVLQTRGEDDRLNWLGVLSACQALVMGGQGSAALAIRTEANDTLAIPAVELMAILLGALNHQSAVYAVAWVHKDAINAITEESGGREAVQAYDITNGWPE